MYGDSHIPDATIGVTGLGLHNTRSRPDWRREPDGNFVTAVADDGVLRDVTFHSVAR